MSVAVVNALRRLFRRSLWLFLFGSALAHAQTARSFPIDRWDPPFNVVHHHVAESYQMLDHVSKKWVVCAVLPHLKDSYWLAVDYGLVSEATRLGIDLRVYEAGGYDKADVQVRQVNACMDAGAQALLVGAIDPDKLTGAISRFLAKGHPVIDFINGGINNPRPTARVASDQFELAERAGAVVLAKSQGKPTRILWFPGPQGVGWSTAANAGLIHALQNSNVLIVDTLWGEPGVAVQTKLLEQALGRHPDLDFVVGNGIAAEAAVTELRRRGLAEKVPIVSYYITINVYRAIQRGSILAVPSDQPALQSSLALDMGVKALEGMPIPKHVSVQFETISKGETPSINLHDSLAPDGFEPIFGVNN